MSSARRSLAGGRGALRMSSAWRWERASTTSSATFSLPPRCWRMRWVAEVGGEAAAGGDAAAGRVGPPGTRPPPPLRGARGGLPPWLEPPPPVEAGRGALGAEAGGLDPRPPALLALLPDATGCNLRPGGVGVSSGRGV